MAPDCVPKSFKKYKYMKWEKLLEEERKTAELYAHIVKTQGGICGNHALPWLVGFTICALVLSHSMQQSNITSYFHWLICPPYSYYLCTISLSRPNEFLSKLKLILRKVKK